MNLSLLRTSWIGESAATSVKDGHYNALLIPADNDSIETFSPLPFLRIADCIADVTRFAVDTSTLFNSLQYSWSFYIPSRTSPTDIPEPEDSSDFEQMLSISSVNMPIPPVPTYYVATCDALGDGAPNQILDNHLNGDVAVLKFQHVNHRSRLTEFDDDEVADVINFLRKFGRYGWGLASTRRSCSCWADSEGVVVVEANL